MDSANPLMAGKKDAAPTTAEIIADPALSKAFLDQAVRDCNALQVCFEQVFGRSPVAAYVAARMFIESLRTAYPEESHFGALDALVAGRIEDAKAQRDAQNKAIQSLAEAFLGKKLEKPAEASH